MQGEAAGQTSLGYMYAEGRGVQQDYVVGYMWSDLSVSRANSGERNRAVRQRDRLAQQMTLDQLVEAQRLAREWDPVNLN